MRTRGAVTEGIVVALGERRIVGAFTLAGAVVHAAEEPDTVRDAWASLEGDVALVILTANAASALGEAIDRADAPLTAVLPT